jgi:hypothetical protein
MRYRALSVLAFTFVLVLAVACDEDEDGTVAVESTPAPFAPYTPQGERRIEEVVIYSDRIEPRQVSFTAGAAAEIEVANRSDADCIFFVGDYVIDLPVPAGETAQMGLTVPEDRSDEVVTMGCRNDPTRRGTAVIEFKGLLPGAGR